MSVILATFHLRERKHNPCNVAFVSSESRERTELVDDVKSLKSFSNFEPQFTILPIPVLPPGILLHTVVRTVTTFLNPEKGVELVHLQNAA